jgi:acetyl esterase/lipase
MMLPWLFLASSSLGLALAANVVRPLRAPGELAVVSFFAGWLVGELATHVLVVQAFVAAAFVARGGLAHWPGYVALASSIVACVLLVLSQRQAARAGDVVTKAFQETRAEQTSLPALGSLPPALDWRRIALPFPVRHPEVISTWHREFHTTGAATLRLDVHRARSHCESGPTLVYVHGGAWVIGHRERQGLPLMMHMAAQGWVCVSVDYRLSPRATFPDHLVDVKRALAWVRAHAEELGADPGFVAIAGNSSGAHLAALAALTANVPEYQRGFEGDDTSVAACMGFYGVYDLLDRRAHWPHRGMERLLERHVMKARRAQARAEYDAASPVARVHPDAPPFLLVHGTHDTLSPVDESRQLFEALRATSRAPVVYVELPGAQHAFDIFPSVRTGHIVDGAARFLALARAHQAMRGTGIGRGGFTATAPSRAACT